MEKGLESVRKCINVITLRRNQFRLVTIVENALAFCSENKLYEFYGGILILRVVGNSHAVNDGQAMEDRVYRFTRDFIKKLKSNGYFLVAISGSPSTALQWFRRTCCA